MTKPDKRGRARKDPSPPKAVKAAGRDSKPAPLTNPATPDLDIEAGGLLYKRPDGTVERLTPLVAECLRLYLRGYTRRDMMAFVKQRYACSTITIDRAWAVAKVEAWESVEADKAKRVKETASRFEHLYRASLETNDYTNARLTLKEKARIMGDDQPDPMGGLMDSGTLDELLRQVQEQEALLAQALKDAGTPDTPPLPGTEGRTK